MFRIKLHICQRYLEGSNKPFAHQETPTESDPELPLSVSYGGTGHKWPATGAGVLGTPDLDMAYTLLEEVTINPTREPPELTQDWGHRLLEGTNKALCEPGPRRKEK